MTPRTLSSGSGQWTGGKGFQNSPSSSGVGYSAAPTARVSKRRPVGGGHRSLAVEPGVHDRAVISTVANADCVAEFMDEGGPDEVSTCVRVGIVLGEDLVGEEDNRLEDDEAVYDLQVPDLG